MTAKTRMVVLDGYTMGQDVSWQGLAQQGELIVHERTPAELVLARSQGAQVLLTNKTVLDAATLKALPDLKCILVLATGFNVVDVAQAAQQAANQVEGVSATLYRVPETLPEDVLGKMGALEASKAQAEVPLHQDQALAREHQRFTQFAIDQMHKMNANIIGGKHSMQVQKHGHGLYRASYKAIDVEGIVCLVRRSPGNPNYFVGSVLYKEHILESVAQAPEASRNGQFLRVSEKQSRIIYSSKPGGGWQ